MVETQDDLSEWRPGAEALGKQPDGLHGIIGNTNVEAGVPAIGAVQVVVAVEISAIGPKRLVALGY